MTANFGLIAHPPQRHPYEFALQCLGDRLPKRRFADAGRTDQAENRPPDFFNQRLYRQIFKDTLLDLVQPIVIFFQNLFCLDQIVTITCCLIPRQRQQHFDIITYHGGFGRQR